MTERGVGAAMAGVGAAVTGVGTGVDVAKKVLEDPSEQQRLTAVWCSFRWRSSSSWTSSMRMPCYCDSRWRPAPVALSSMLTVLHRLYDTKRRAMNQLTMLYRGQVDELEAYDRIVAAHAMQVEKLSDRLAQKQVPLRDVDACSCEMWMHASHTTAD